MFDFIFFVFFYLFVFFFFFFFFSSRRRHTRCGRDWSSDVCSSDLISSGFVAPSGCTHTQWAFGSARSMTTQNSRSSAFCLSRGWPSVSRSEEHTSELQSRPHLVCRLLLEKKKPLRSLRNAHISTAS